MEKESRPDEVLFVLAVVFGVMVISMYAVSAVINLVFNIIQ
jgi:hypothetical protein